MKVSDTSTYLEAAVLGDRDVTVEIESARRPGPKDIGTDGRPISDKSVIIHYLGKEKGHVACRTTQKQIRRLHGDDITAWSGKKIILFQTTCDAFGQKDVPCIRVRNIDPATGAPPEL